MPWTPAVTGLTRRRYVRYARQQMRPIRYAKSGRLTKAAHAALGAARIGSRATPIGWAFLGYEIYSIAKSHHDKQSVKSPSAYVDPFLFENITQHRYVQGYNTTPISVWRTM
jgi:hypothetical protein